MTTRPFRSRAVGAAAVAALVAGGIGVLAGPARATSGFSLARISGADRYQTAGLIDKAAFPSGEPTALLADGIPGHQTDALAASGLEGVSGIGVLVTDNGTKVPANTLAALSSNKVKTIFTLGGTAAVSQAEINQLKGDGYAISSPFAGANRYQTMQMIDDSISSASVGKDAAGNPTAILASGDNAHFVDALSAGGLAYAQHFPIILTNSQGPGLAPEAQQVITQLGIKHLIVVGGTSSIPASEYTPPPVGITSVTTEAGADRSQTSQQLGDYAIANGWLGDTALTLARGDDGSDALAGAAYSGVKKAATVVTDSPSAVGSAPAFAQEHRGTLNGVSHVFGGSSAVTDSEISAVETAGGATSTAPPGSFSPGAISFVTSASSSSFGQSGYTYSYSSSDSYQIDKTVAPGAPPSCVADSHSDFQSRLGPGDKVSGTYNPGGKSTFCLDDISPAPPTSVSATGNGSAGGVTVSWPAPATATLDHVTGYEVWRAAPSATGICPAAYSVAPDVSPQTGPGSSYSLLATVTVASSGTNWSYNDTKAASPNSYCYAVSAVSPNEGGGRQPATAEPNNPSRFSPTGGAGGTPVKAAVATGAAVPSMTGVGVVGQTIALTYNEAVNPSTVDANASDFTVALTPNAVKSPTVRAWASGSTVYLDYSARIPSGDKVTVSDLSGSDGNTVCAANSTTACERSGQSEATSKLGAPLAAPTLVAATTSGSGQSVPTVTVTLSHPIDCVTVDTSAGQYKVTEAGASGASIAYAAGCVGNGPTSSQVVLATGPLVSGATVTVTYAPDSQGPVVSSAEGNAESAAAPGNTISTKVA